MGRLGHAGQSTAFCRKVFKDGFGRQVMNCILEAWQALKIHKKIRLETCITALLGDQLNKDFTAGGREWLAIPEAQVTDPTFGTQLGRNDIRFIPAPHRHRTTYFTAECKRLNVRTSSGFKHLADEYVKKGMQRFVDGQYSNGVPCGGMVGYVMDNELDTAFDRIKAEMKINVAPLCIRTRQIHKSPSVALPYWRHSADTRHLRNGGSFILHHLLVGVE